MPFTSKPGNTFPLVEYDIETSSSERDSDQSTSCTDQLLMHMMPKETRLMGVHVSVVGREKLANDNRFYPNY